MANTNKIVFSPLVGFDNIVQVKDPDDGLLKPYVYLDQPGAEEGFIPISSFDEEELFSIVPGGTGRKGNMKTALLLVMVDDLGTGLDAEIDMLVKIPSGLRGLAPAGVLGAAPGVVIDPTLFSPSIQFGPTFNALLGDGDSQQVPDGAGSFTFQGGPFPGNGGFEPYITAAKAKELQAAGELSNIGLNGLIHLKLTVQVPAAEELEENQLMQLVVDFNHSISN